MKRVYKEHCIAFLGFLLLAVLMTLPVALKLTSSIAGTGGDPWQSMWRFEAKEASSISGFLADLFGFGEARLANLSVWPWMPLHLLFGQPLAYNIIWILHFVLAGYAMALLIKTLTNQTSILRPAPLLAGILYMFMPYHVAHSLGHFGAMQLEWIPFIAVAAISFFRNPRVFSAVVLGLLLTVQAWTEHHYILWVALFGLLAGFVYRKELINFLPSYEGRRPACRTGRGGVDALLTTPSRSPLYKGEKSATKFYSLVLLLIILVIGVIFPYIPTIKLASTNSDALELGITQTIRFSADLFSFIVPPSYHPIWGTVSHNLFGQFFTGNEAESVQYLGISAILAILFFHKHIPVKQKRLWIATIVLFGIMSLGPVLHIFGKETSLPLPYALFANLPVFSAIRVIARAGVMVSFATTVLFGWVIATNSIRPRASYIVACIILLEFLFVPFPMQSAKLSPVYDLIQDIPGSNIIEIPAATNYTAASRSLYAMQRHDKSVLGNIALERGQDENINTLVKSTPSIRQLLYLRTTDLAENRKEFFNQDLLETLPDAMKYLDAHSIIIHTDSVSTLQLKAVTDFLETKSYFTKELFKDAVLYTLDASKNPDTDGIFMIRGQGWEHVGYDPKKERVFAEIPKEARMKFVNINEHPVSINLIYSLAPESHGELQVQDRYGALHVGDSFVVNPGEHEVVFRHIGENKSILQNPSFTVRDIAIH